MATETGKDQDAEIDPEVLERGRLLFAAQCEFLKGVVALEGLPPTDLVEVAFAGRSNVGKSSLLNALTGRKTLARTSSTPGRTREINFFRLGRPEVREIYLVDLPGYGYARVSKTQVDAWVGLLKSYLQGRPNLRRVMLLIDARHGLKASDIEIMTLLDVAAVNYQIVLTKLDKLKAGDVERIRAAVSVESRKHAACHPEIIATSAVKGTGIPELRAEVASVASS